jgi:hypothetical protein
VVGKMKNNKIKKLIYEYDMMNYMFYVKAGYIPKKRMK